MPASTALVTNAIILYFETLMPTDSAAMRLSRVAMIARPVRLLIRFSTTNSVNRISAKPMPKVAIFSTPVAPAGPLTTTVQLESIALNSCACTRSSASVFVNTFGSVALATNFSVPGPIEMYRQFRTFRMISPNASVTIAR